MRQACDEAGIRAGTLVTPCLEKSRPWILAATITGSSMAFIDGTVVNIALPALQSSFGASVVGVQWVVEAYGLTLASAIVWGLAASIQQLIAARAVQGIGAAFLVPGSLALISASFDENQRGRAIGTCSGATASPTAIGPS